VTKVNSHLFHGCFLRNWCLLTTFLSDSSRHYRRADFWRKRAQRLLPQGGCDNYIPKLVSDQLGNGKKWSVVWSHLYRCKFSRPVTTGLVITWKQIIKCSFERNKILWKFKVSCNPRFYGKFTLSLINPITEMIPYIANCLKPHNNSLWSFRCKVL